MPEHLVSVAGTRIHITCMGEGIPAVVLVSGAGGLSAFWSLVQPAVAALTRVCTYDRPGYLRSEARPKDSPLTAGRAAEDLHTLLGHIDADPPYVLVGHSFGGFVIRLYAARYPDEVAGIVLVDADHEDEWTSLYPEAHRKGLRLAQRTVQVLARLSLLGIPQAFVRLQTPEPLRRLPIEARRTALSGFGPKTLRTIAREFDALEESAKEVEREGGSLGTMPLIVLRRGRPGPVAPGVSREEAAHLEQLAVYSQENLARLSQQGELWVAENSGHDIQIEQPELVVKAVHTVVEQVRRSRA